jgi:hypothetical protein
MDANGQNMKAVFAVVERGPGKSFWVRVGVGFVNRDGSITLKLDAIPVNGTLQVREWESRDDGARRAGGGAGAGDHEGDNGNPFGPPGRPRPRRDEAPRRPTDAPGGLA